MPSKKGSKAPGAAKAAHASAPPASLREGKAAPAPEGKESPPEALPLAHPVVAVGASAGGIDAFRRLLAAMPADTGMAFVMVLHLSPQHDSMLAEILARATRLPVVPAADGQRLEPNRVYVIPPGVAPEMQGGCLRLAPDGMRPSHVIDSFMRSLAESQRHAAIGVVLSGTGSDGMLGLQAIKGSGGITFAQDESAEQAGMPRSAIAAGGVDFVLSPEGIAGELGRIARHPYVAERAPAPAPGAEPAFARVIEILREATGVDFSNYKRNTLHRRIARRIVLLRLQDLGEYLHRLESDAAEVDALYRDVLINVTSFFRDPPAFEALKAIVFPRLTAERGRNEPLRTWVLGCSTGEEAYSIAMAYAEFCDGTSQSPPMQVFATDLSAESVEKARRGTYPRAMADDLTPERVRRFFTEADGSLRVSKAIRDMCVFARQNALVDPPFSRMDLVACRNVLIYLEPVLQQRLIPLLHYALRPEGFLWLGTSETIGGYRDLFEQLDARNKVYARRGPPGALPPRPPGGWPVRAARSPGTGGEPRAESPKEVERILLSRYAPPGVVVDRELQIVQFRGDTGAFLAPAPGSASLNLLRMLREGLLVGVRGAIQCARREDAPVREAGLRVRANGGWRDVDVVVLPLSGADAPSGSLLVLFEEPGASVESRSRELEQHIRSEADHAEAQRDLAQPDREVVRLKQELAATREYLQSMIEQQEAANEELQSANEEVQSANEELQSINEELETSKEEIQSTNEELATVNEELQDRNEELSRSNDDLMNLLASVQIAIVMVGADLRIRRFTPAAEKLLNLIAADVGRPIADVRLAIDVPDLARLLAEVIDSVSPRERDVRDRDGRWYSLRLHPYRTQDNRIDGAVLALVDIDNLKRAEQALRESEARFELLADSAPVLIWTTEADGRRFVNRAYQEFVGEPESAIARSEPGRFVHPDDRPAFASRLEQAVHERRPFEARARFRRADGAYRWMKAIALPRFLPEGGFVGYVGCAFDVTDMKEAENALVELDQGRNQFLAMLAHELRNPLAGVRNAARVLARSRDESVVAPALGIIERQGERMARMVDDLLDVSRMAHGKMELHLEPVDLAAVAREALQLTAPEREASAQVLEASLPEEALWVRGDAMRLEQVLCNLLQNASKFTRAGGSIWIEAGREPGETGTPPSAVVRVRDDGAGMEPAILARAFELFAQGEHAGSQPRRGIGIGLALARRLVELHGGSVEAHSDGAGKGSEFVVRLPLLARTPSRRPSPASAPAPTAARRVLIVDDNRDSAESLRLVLGLHGHEARVVHEGAAAAGAAAAFRPDVVLLDIALPDVDGLAVARALRAEAPTRGALIVAVSGFGREEDVRRSQEAGIDEHFTKPVDPDRLLERIARGR